MPVDMNKLVDLDRLKEYKTTENNGIAPVETTSTASKAYKTGERFYFQGKLCIATNDIAQGGTITLNTNCKLDLLGDDVSALQTAFTYNAENRLNIIDGITVPDMEQGAIAFASSVIAYQESTTAIRTPNGKAVPVEVGDVIGLSDYTDGRRYKYAILKTADGKYTYDSARTTDFVVRNAGYVYIVAGYADSRVIDKADPIYQMVRIKKNNGTLDSISSSISTIEAKLDDPGGKELYIGSLVNAHLTATGNVHDSFDDYRLSSENILALPCGSNRKLKVHINDDYLFSMRIGADARNLNIAKYWYADGAEITLDDGVNYYGISVCNKYGGGSYTAQTISPTEDIGLVVTFTDGNDVKLANSNAEKILANARLDFSVANHNYMNNYAVIGHTSDCHGDYQRVKNFFDFCDHVSVDAACVTGDIVSFYPKDGVKWFQELATKAQSLPAICVGNHDINADNFTDSDAYDFMFDAIATKLQNATGKTWYYFDIASKKLRVISVNLYQYGGSRRNYSHMTSEQISWLITTLAATPENYGVIILHHSPQVDLDHASVSGYTEFYQTDRQFTNLHNDITDGVPLYDIVDAFISKGTLSKTYTQTGSDTSLAVSADFSSVASGVEFIAYLTGHFHQDTVCIVPNTTNRQLMLNVTCTISAYGPSGYPYLANLQDQGRNCLDSSQDAFNIYVIDRDNKNVKIVRVGCDKTYNMGNRQYMSIPYAV